MDPVAHLVREETTSIRQPPNERAYPDRLCHDVDSGRTRDKVAFPDPAAAPLGADEEAAGTPVSREAVVTARKIETSRTRPQERVPDGIKARIVGAAVAITLGLIATVVLLH